MSQIAIVLGAQGQLGQTFFNQKSTAKDLDLQFCSRKEIDLSGKLDSLETVFETKKVAYCINCAAYTQVDKSEEEKELSLEINANSLIKIATLCQKYKVKLIHFSTDFVFEGKNKTPYKETDATIPVNHYGYTKLEGEKNIAKYCEEYFIFRVSWLYSSCGNNFFKTMIRLGKEREQLKVVNDQIGSPTLANDLVEFIFWLIQDDSQDYGLYHFSNLGNISWYDFAKEILIKNGIKTPIYPIPSSQFPTPAHRPSYSVLDTQKISKTFGYKIKNWKESLEKISTLE